MTDNRALSKHYRYRTRALVGAWQPTVGRAFADAVKAGQASIDASGQIQWIVSGEIEEGEVAGE